MELGMIGLGRMGLEFGKGGISTPRIHTRQTVST
jgi:6-phosphogluconate dehydrogenase (decarboxylating)